MGFFRIFLLIFAAEAGDKTQLLLVSLASKYKLRQLLLGTGGAILLLCALATGLGRLMGALFPTEGVQTVSGLAFLYFAYCALRGEEEKATLRGKGSFAVFCTFFLAELGDKTQLATLTLAAEAGEEPYAVLLGSAAGLFAADLLGLLLGKFLKDRVPTGLLTGCSFCAFASFGVTALHGGLSALLPAGKALLLTLAICMGFAMLCGRKWLAARLP